MARKTSISTSAYWILIGMVSGTTSFSDASEAAALANNSSNSLIAKGVPVVLDTPVTSTAALFAQIVPDNTLGNEPSELVSDILVEGTSVSLIEGGAIRGSNLFHSFQKFSIDAGQQAYFSSPNGVENILSRVTGDTVSHIDGLLGVDGNASLFFLDPNGIIFGPNAELDISGSFTASTAERLMFSDSSEFRTNILDDYGLLSISTPLGVQFNDQYKGDIVSTGKLEVGQSLSIVGNQLYVEGQLAAENNLLLNAQDTVTIQDTATDAFSARAGQNLTIQGSQGIDILTLQHLDQTPFTSGGTLSLLSNGMISADAHFDSGGALQFLTLDRTPGNIISLYDPVIFADGSVVFGDYTGVALKVEAAGSIGVRLCSLRPGVATVESVIVC